jgi:hypothetical protein
MGDAFTNFLCIEQSLAYLNTTTKLNFKEYEDLYCLNSKVAIKDKSKLKVVYTEDKITEPISV